MAEPVCPYCRMPFDEASPPRIFCTACGTPHHQDCYQENGGCTVFGCSRAPADDPKLQVSQNDLRAVNIPQAYPAAQPYTPVQSVGTVQYPPSPYGGPLGLSQAAAAPAAGSPAQASSLPQAASYPYVQTASPGYQYAAPPIAYGRSSKSRTTYIVLGIFLGGLGVHNFYAGYTGRAVGQLCLSVLTLGYLAIVSWIWAIVEICIVTKDNMGLEFN
ncbi:MAG: NINE protein [Candidatus Angelobacter sp.]